MASKPVAIRGSIDNQIWYCLNNSVNWYCKVHSRGYSCPFSSESCCINSNNMSMQINQWPA
uniref:Protease Do-like 5ic n=1 Tax=Rhizophora mucronata TaxID=61149 RepID=A0A2P2KH39_RHIMU